MDRMGCSNATGMIGILLMAVGFITGIIGSFAGNGMGFLIFFIGLAWFWGHMSN